MKIDTKYIDGLWERLDNGQYVDPDEIRELLTYIDAIPLDALRAVFHDANEEYVQYPMYEQWVAIDKWLESVTG